MAWHVGDGNTTSSFVFTIIFFIPESPRWLILKGREERGLNVLQRIYNSAEEAMNQMNETKSVVSETKSEWALLLQPGILKAVIIGVAIAILGQFMGVNAVLYYGPSIFEKLGFPVVILCFIKCWLAWLIR